MNTKQYRVNGGNNVWFVECIDNNQVWVMAEPGRYYQTQAEAESAMDEMAECAD